MSPEQLVDIDLNLLVVLDVLLEERGVTRAAQRLHLTPSAVSHALRRLRAMFDDELLVRDGRHMRPTVRALELGETVPRALRQLRRALAAPVPFEPGTSTRTFRLAAPDFMAPRVLQEVATAAPRVKVEWVPASPTAVRELTQGHYDALIAPGAFEHEGARGHDLGEWPWRVYGRAGHPAFDRWSLDAWSTYPHLQIATSVLRGQGPIDQRVGELGVERRVGAIVPYFSMAAPIVAETDLLLTVPSISMQHALASFGLEHREVPFELPRMRLSLFRSATNGHEQGVRWFVERIEAACRKLAA